MNLKVALMSLVLASCCFTGCLGEEEDPPSRFSWPESESTGCEVSSDVFLNCTEYVTGFTTPVKVLHHPVLDEIWIVDLSGHISSWDGQEKREIANLSESISTCHNEQGLLGMEFTDDFATTGMVLLSYIETGPCRTDYAANLTLAEATVINGTITEENLNVIFEIEQPFRNHNGGSIQGLGSNEYLWGIGDGGSSKDPLGNGQNRSNLFGSIVMFKHANHSIEPVLFDEDGNETFVLHYGLRNPWKFDVDASGGLWIADVGQYCFEEVNYIENYTHAANFGWSVTEGLHQFRASDENCDVPLYEEENSSITLPIIEYDHNDGNCSVTGGEFVEWRKDSLNNSYVFGDFCSGLVWMTQPTVDGVGHQQVADTNLFLVGFGQGLNDELLLLTWTGEIYALT